jgi:hypothetical protein
MKWSKGLKIKKDPDATLDYAFDWSEWLGTDTIGSYEVSIQPGLTIANHYSDPTEKKVIIWLSGGTIGDSYNLLCRVRSVLGRTDDRSIAIVVESK